MRILLFIAALIFCAHAAFADETVMAEKVAKIDFPGWEVFSAVTGDLDGDGIKDLAMILQKHGKNEDDGAEVKLAVYFVDWQGRHFRQAVSDNAICYGCGGVKAVWNQPFGDISIDKGILNILYQGGSREEFETTAKWRFDKTAKKFLLIGETENTIDTAQEEPEDKVDINFLSMKMIHSIGKKSKTCPVPANYKRIDLEAFNYEERNEDMLEKLGEACKP